MKIGKQARNVVEGRKRKGGRKENIRKGKTKLSIGEKIEKSREE